MIERTSSGIFDAWNTEGMNVYRAIKARHEPGHWWRVVDLVTGRERVGLDLAGAMAALQEAGG